MQSAYGELREESSGGTTIILWDAGDWTGWETSSGGESLLTSYTYSLPSDRIHIDAWGKGMYKINFKIDCKINRNDSIFKATVFKNWVEQTGLNTYLRTGDQGSDYVNGKIQGLMALVVWDYVDVRFTNMTHNNRQIELYNASLILDRKKKQ